MSTNNDDINETKTNKKIEDGNENDSDSDIVDPYNVVAKGENGIDYDKLIVKFGAKPIKEDLISYIIVRLY